MVDDEVGWNNTALLTEMERAAIISRIHSLLFWVGKFIPQHEIVQGREIDLRDVIFQFISRENPTSDEIQGAMDLADLLEIKARALEKEIKDREVTKANAFTMLDEICGLLRAVDDLRNSHGDVAKYQKTALMAKVNDERRWLQFVDQLKIN